MGLCDGFCLLLLPLLLFLPHVSQSENATTPSKSLHSHNIQYITIRSAGALSASDMEHMFNRAPAPVYQVRLGWSIARLI
jgi:hypothetical protein